MTGELYINGRDAYETWGVGLEDHAISALMTPAPQKDLINNKSRLEAGKRVVITNPQQDERDITLELHLIAETRDEFFEKYNSFCQELAKGRLVLKTKWTGDTQYKTDYKSCEQFAAYQFGIGKFTLKLNEPNPADR